MNAAPHPRDAVTHEREPSDAFGLPAWIYHDPDFFALEKRSIFRTSWQLVCHVNDIPAVGDYHCLDLLGESIVVVRGADDAIRSFHNVCRHRASRLLDGPKGRCSHRIVCPYHAWTYTLEGELRTAPFLAEEDGFSRAEFPLHPVGVDQWGGFLFVHLEPGRATVPGATLLGQLGGVPERLARYPLAALRTATSNRATY